MRVAYFGSGSFGLPTLEWLIPNHEVCLAVTQPDRPAGRRRHLTPTPVAMVARQHGIETLKPEQVNDPTVVASIHGTCPDVLVVIAYGQKLGRDLLDGLFAINLHGSLLPKGRGAAPINWSIIHGCAKTGLSVITLADRMDAGCILGQSETSIGPTETAGELHDRLAALGPDLVGAVLEGHQARSLSPLGQDESAVTRAPKLSRADARVDFDQSADRVRCRIHGLTPWPGCAVTLGGMNVKLCRVESAADETDDAVPGTILADHSIACRPGRIRPLEVQPAGKRVMTFDEFLRGHDLAVGSACGPVTV